MTELHFQALSDLFGEKVSLNGPGWPSTWDPPAVICWTVQMTDLHHHTWVSDVICYRWNSNFREMWHSLNLANEDSMSQDM